MSIHTSGSEHKRPWVFSCPWACPRVSACGSPAVHSSSPARPTPSLGTQLEETQVSATLGRKQGAPFPRELIKGGLASESEMWARGEPGGKACSGAWTRSRAGLSAHPGGFYAVMMVLRV